jgi:hypothetical protein
MPDVLATQKLVCALAGQGRKASPYVKNSQSRKGRRCGSNPKKSTQILVVVLYVTYPPNPCPVFVSIKKDFMFSYRF